MAAIAIRDTGEARVLELSGRLDAASIRGVWSDARRAIKEAADRRIVIDAEKVDYCDGAGIGLIVDMLRQRKRGEVEVTNLKPAFSALLKQFDVEVLDHDLDPEPKRGSSIEEIGEIASGVGHDMYEQVSFVRELGPLMTAILLAGRSGAAFAAEIGTMKVNQEVDALTTMGLDPVRFLVTTRVIAAFLMTPLLTLFADLVSLIGGAMTLQSFS